MNEQEKIDIRTLSTESLQKSFEEWGEKPFRAKQVQEWLWKKSASDFSEMTNLSIGLREKLEDKFVIRAMKVGETQISDDGTVKCVMSTYDRKVIESVLIPTSARKTACISSQVGCSLSCAFCATGKLKRLRDLDYSEIYDQVVAVNQLSLDTYKTPLTNIVYMGMGEPLMNYKNMIESVDKITSDKGLGMSAKRITVSTAGIAKQIKRLGDDGVKFNLAISLHAANDKKRSEIMPINKSNTLDSLSEALSYYFEKTKNRVTFEYIIFKDFNDSIQDADELIAFCRKVPSKVNIIEYNPIDDGKFQKADEKKVDRFAAHLEKKGIIAKIRRSRGKDIDAACGQLANKNKLAKEV